MFVPEEVASIGADARVVMAGGTVVVGSGEREVAVVRTTTGGPRGSHMVTY